MTSYDVFKDAPVKKKEKKFEQMNVDEKLIFLNANQKIVSRRIDSLHQKFATEEKAKTLFSQWLKKSFRSIFLLRRINNSLNTRLVVFGEIRFLLDGCEDQATVLRGYAMAADFDDAWWDERDQMVLRDWINLLRKIGQEKSFLIACEKYKGRESDKHVISTDEILEEEDQL